MFAYEILLHSHKHISNYGKYNSCRNILFFKKVSFELFSKRNTFFVEKNFQNLEYRKVPLKFWITSKRRQSGFCTTFQSTNFLSMALHTSNLSAHLWYLHKANSISSFSIGHHQRYWWWSHYRAEKFRQYIMILKKCNNNNNVLSMTIMSRCCCLNLSVLSYMFIIYVHSVSFTFRKTEQNYRTLLVYL